MLAALRLLGLFDRPAENGCLTALRKPPAIPGLTEPLMNLTGAEWNIAVNELAKCGLVSIPKTNTALDSHPLIREYFAEPLGEESQGMVRGPLAALRTPPKDHTA